MSLAKTIANIKFASVQTISAIPHSVIGPTQNHTYIQVYTVRNIIGYTYEEIKSTIFNPSIS